MFGIRDAAKGIDFAGRTDHAILAEILDRHGIRANPWLIRQFFDIYLKCLARLLGRSRGGVHAGVAEFMQALQGQPKPPVIGLLTGNVRLGAEIKLRNFNLWNQFRFGAFGDDHPDRDELAAIARTRGGRFLHRQPAPEEILVVGDTPRDIQCARAIGAQCLAVATGRFSVRELKAHSPAIVVRDLREITAPRACL